MKVFKYNYDSGHILFDVNGLVVLFDTGAPNSVGSGSFSFIDNDYDLQNNYMGLTTSTLSEYIGTQVDILMGADIINNYDICIDSMGNKITFGENLSIDEYENVLDIKDFMGIPIIDVTVEGKSMSMFFDTGAHLSYIEPSITNNYSSAGEKEDFYPGVGTFKTNTFDILTTIGKREMTVKYGVLPEMLQMTLMMADTQGIIGTEIFKYYKCVLSNKRKTLFLRNLQ